MAGQYEINLSKDQAIDTANRMKELAEHLREAIDDASNKIKQIEGRSNATFIQEFQRCFNDLKAKGIEQLADRIVALSEQLKATAVAQDAEAQKNIQF